MDHGYGAGFNTMPLVLSAGRYGLAVGQTHGGVLTEQGGHAGGWTERCH